MGRYFPVEGAGHHFAFGQIFQQAGGKGRGFAVFAIPNQSAGLHVASEAVTGHGDERTAALAVAVPALRRLLPVGTFRARPGVPAAIAGNGFLNMAFFSADAFIPYLLTTHRGYSTFVAGMALTSATLSWTAGSWLQERLDHRVSRAARAAVGGALVMVGLAATSLALIDGVPGAFVAVTWAVAGLGIGIAYPTFSLEMMAGTQAGREGETSSAMKLTETLAGAAGIGVAGGIVAAGEAGGWAAGALAGVFVLAGAAGVMTMLTATRISRHAAAFRAHEPGGGAPQVVEAVP